jgi:hypothetical protein
MDSSLGLIVLAVGAAQISVICGGQQRVTDGYFYALIVEKSIFLLDIMKDKENF